MADAKEVRRSDPFRTDDAAISLSLIGDSPLEVAKSKVDASRLPATEPVRLLVRSTVDWGSLRRATGATGPLSVLLVSRCISTRWSSIERIATDDRSDTAAQYEVVLEIERRNLAGAVQCECIIVPDTSASTAGQELRDGVILARAGFKIALERGGMEFPTEWRSFATIGQPASALWILEFSADDWGLPARDTVKIRLNKDLQSFYDLLQNPSRDKKAAAELLYAQIAYDCLATLIERYLATEAADEPVDPSGDALRDVVARNIDRLMGRVSPELRKLARERPSRLRARIQDAMNIAESVP